MYVFRAETALSAAREFGERMARQPSVGTAAIRQAVRKAIQIYIYIYIYICMFARFGHPLSVGRHVDGARAM